MKREAYISKLNKPYIKRRKNAVFRKKVPHKIALQKSQSLQNNIFFNLIPSVVSLIAIFISSFVIYTQNSTRMLAEPINIPENFVYPSKEDDKPQRILIPKIFVDASVKEAKVENGTWQTYEDSASFGVGSAFPNTNNGNTVIFAHAKARLFSELDKLNEKDVVYVLGKDGWYRYFVDQKFYVLPNDIGFLSKDYGRSLILFTCYGADDEKRVVIIAKFEGKEDGKI